MATTPFIPRDPADAVLTASLKDTPRYLFRVFDRHSAGETTARYVSSAAFKKKGDPGDDLFQIEPELAARRLSNHMLWEGNTHPTSQEHLSNLVSWTSSLLSALQYMLFRSTPRRGKPCCDLSEIHMLVVDTHQFAEGTFARDLQVLEAFRDHSRGDKNFKLLYDWRTTGTYYSGEYFSQGQLTIDPEMACLVTIQELIDAGLFTVCPQLEDRYFRDKWAKAVNNLRKELSPLDASHNQIVMNIAASFGLFEIPIALMIFSMSQDGVRTYGADYVQAVMERYSRDELGQVRPEFFTAHTNLPELKRCHELASNLDQELAKMQGSPAELQKLIEALSSLSMEAKEAGVAMRVLAGKAREMQAQCSEMSKSREGSDSHDEFLYRILHYQDYSEDYY